MAESAQLMRQWRILQLLSRRTRGVTLKELSLEMEVKSRTILRDLNVLRTVGFQLQETLGEHGKKYWKLCSESGIANLKFTMEEAAALYLGRQFLEAFAGTFFWQGSQTAYRKIQTALSESAILHLQKLSTCVHLTHLKLVDYSTRAQMIDDLMMAMEDRCLTVITYQSLRSTEPVTFYDVHPYTFVFHKGALYLIAWSLDHDAIRTFKIDRISEVEVQTGVMKFTRPKQFDIADLLGHSFGIFSGDREPQRVRVHFSAQVVRILEEKQFHASQQLTKQADGSVVAEYCLSTWEEFRSFVLSFGRHARVLEPLELIQSLREELKLMQENYQEEVSRYA